jgi:hypothetical protein
MKHFFHRKVSVRFCLVLGLLAQGVGWHQVMAREIRVVDEAALHKALAEAAPGDEIVLTEATYQGAFRMANRSGTETAPIVIRGADPAKPPVMKGRAQAFHLSDCSYVEMRDLRVDGASANGINIDDGGSYDTPARGIRLQNVTVENIGPTGNFDALKLSGLEDFHIVSCSFSGWGGSAIDMVGCRKGRIESSKLTGRAGFSQSSGIQMKGGTRDVVVSRVEFREAGSRAVNLGGSTGLEFFRPAIEDFEAKDIVVEHCLFVGGECAIAHVGAVGGKVQNNTIVNPGKWVLRILQENTDARFQFCNGGLWENNVIIVDGKVSVPVNVGPNTKPETFIFRGNLWHDSSGRLAKPGWPGKVTDEILDLDPEVEWVANGQQKTPVFRSTDKRLAGKGIQKAP